MADGTVTIKINVDGKDVELELGRVKGQIKDTGETANEVGKNSLLVTAAISTGLGAITKKLIDASFQAYTFSSQFNAAFAKTKTIMDTNVVSAGAMRNAVLQLSRDSAMAAGDVSEAVYQAISGSVDTADAVKFVDNANKLAVAGFTSLTNATDVLTTSLNAYHLGAENVEGISNVLIRTQNLGKTSVDELAGSIGKAIATGSAYGVNLQNISTAYVELTRNGISTAESTTYINSMLNELGDSGKTVGKILQEKTGKSFGRLMQDGASLGDVLQILLESVDGNTEAFMGLWGSQEAGKAANAIASQSIADFNKVLEQMNAEMSGTTGTTEQAYETMTSTSEYIDKRLTNSVQNLAIAYGDILAPPLDAIKSLGADILDGITKLINRSPAAAAAIAAVSTGVVVLAGGLAALLIIEKVKAAFADFGGVLAALSANPVILAVAGISALVMGITALVGALSDSNEQLEAFNEGIQEIDKSYYSEMAAVEVASERTNGYIKRLQELERTGLRTTEQQEEYHQILEELVETIPELSSLIDLETDTINGGTAALQNNTKAWEENAKQQAYQKYLADLTEAYTNALIEQKAAEIELQDKKAEKSRQLEEERNLLNAINQLYDDANAAADEFNEKNGTELTADTFLNEESLNQLESDLNDLRKAISDTDDEIETLGKNFADATEVVSKAKEPVDRAEKAIAALGKAEEDASDSTAALGSEISEAGNQLQATGEKIAPIKGKAVEITKSLQAWADQYGELYKAAKSSLENQFKLWEQVAQVNGVSVKKANQGIQSQINYWNAYNTNLQTIKNSSIAGIGELYKFIADGSADSVAMAAGIADAIRKGNEPAVAEMVGLYQELAQAQGETAGSMLSMQTDMDKALGDLLSSVDTAIGDMEMPDAAWNAAHNTVLAYARGLYDGTSDAVSAARAVVNAAQRTLSGQSTVSSSKSKRGGPVMTAYASGTSYADAGLALVGEEGPELIWLRGGERILTSDETREALRGMYPALDTASYAGAAAPASVGGGPAGAQQMTIVVPVEVDGRELARVTAQAMGEEMMFNAY